MRVFSLRALLCLTLAALVSSTTFAGVRGKATKPQEPAPTGRRIAQSDSEYTGVNSRPVPPPADANITNERVVHERVVEPANTISSDPTGDSAALRSTIVYTQTPVMMSAPMTAQPVMQMSVPMTMSMPMVAGQGCSACGGGGYVGLSPANAAIYDQAFGPGLYRSGAEVGQHHFPYYSYRRPWYFPGQPSFHRSTDYVW